MTEGDQALSQAIYASTRADEMAMVPWSPEQKEQFIAFQFDAQRRHYEQHFPRAAFDMVVKEDAVIGRFFVDRTPDEIRIIDIALLPTYRGSGIGSALIRPLLDEAARAGKPVRIHVERENRARQLYDRLGFVPVDSHGIYELMEWRAA